MPTIDSVHVAENLTALWGINAYEYQVEQKQGDTATKVQVDFQDLMIAVSERRATAVEGEIAPLTTRIRARNKELDLLGSILAKFTQTQALYDHDAGGNAQEYLAEDISDEELPLAQEAYRKKGGSPGGSSWFNDTTWSKASVEGMVSILKSMIDSRNNEAQTDMNRLQSLVDRRDESYSTATNLMTAISDTRSNLIRNL